MLETLSQKITRWADVTAHPTFSDRYSEIQRIYRAHKEAQTLIDDICAEHALLAATRLKAKGQDVPLDRLKQSSVSYMLEEIAGLAVIHSLDPAPEIYPGLFFENPETFNQYSSGPNLRIPSVRPVRFIPATQEKENRFKDAA